MVELSVLGIFPRQPGDTPEVFLFAHDTDRILSFHTPRSESMALCALLHCSDDDSPAAGAASPATQHSSAPVEPYDDITDICAALGGRVSKVVLVGMDSGGCEAEVRLDSVHGPLFQICGPAEGVVLAVRYALPVYGTPELMEQAEQVSSVLDSLAPEPRMVLMWKLATLRAYPTSRVHGLWFERLKEQTRDLQECDVGKAERTTRRAIFNLLAKHRAEAMEREHKTPEAPLRHGETTQPGKLPTQQLQDGQQLDNLLDLTEILPENTLALLLRGEALPLEGSANPAGEKDDPSDISSCYDLPASARVRISLIRKNADEAKILEECTVLLHDGKPTHKDGETLNLETHTSGAVTGEEERWTDLLLRLSPETKVLM